MWRALFAVPMLAWAAPAQTAPPDPKLYWPDNALEEINRATAAKCEIALGVVRRNQPGAGLMLNPDREVELHLEPEDAVVLLSNVGGPNETAQVVSTEEP